MAPTRREFLAAGIGLSCGFGLLDEAPAQARSDLSGPEQNDKKLVVLRLEGGNDGLNTLVPYRSEEYAKLRSESLRLAQSEVIQLEQSNIGPALGLHPALAEIHQLYKRGHVAFLPTVVIPHGEHSFSHVRASQIWESGRPDIIGDTGWLGRYMDRSGSTAVFFDNDENAPLILTGDKKNRVVRHCTDRSVQSLSTIADMINAGTAAQIYCATMPGFDTHAAQAARHGELLGQLSQAVGAFFARVENKNVLLLVYSEFGRKLTENNDGGTDHGSAGLCMVAGAPVRGGIFGNYDDLSRFETATGENTKNDTDFRTVYATILERWLGADSVAILGGKYPQMDFC